MTVPDIHSTEGKWILMVSPQYRATVQKREHTVWIDPAQNEPFGPFVGVVFALLWHGLRDFPVEFSASAAAHAADIGWAVAQEERTRRATLPPLNIFRRGNDDGRGGNGGGSGGKGNGGSGADGGGGKGNILHKFAKGVSKILPGSQDDHRDTADISAGPPFQVNIQTAVAIQNSPHAATDVGVWGGRRGQRRLRVHTRLHGAG